MALDEKKSVVLEKWFRDHIPYYYIQVDKEFADCSAVKELLRNVAVK